MAPVLRPYAGVVKKMGEGCVLTIVGIFLVAGFGEDVVLNTLLAECVHAFEALGIAKVFEADLTDEELVVKFLGQTDSVPAACQRPKVFFLVGVGCRRG